MPITPPPTEMKEDSIRNWKRMPRRFPPTERRMPISPLRSRSRSDDPSRGPGADLHDGPDLRLDDPGPHQDAPDVAPFYPPRFKDAGLGCREKLPVDGRAARCSDGNENNNNDNFFLHVVTPLSVRVFLPCFIGPQKNHPLLESVMSIHREQRCFFA